MEATNHDDIACMERENWWYVSRRNIADELLRDALPRQAAIILDVGCGVGSNLPALRPHAQAVHGLDISPRALKYARRQGFDSLTEASAEKMPYPDESVDTVICMDALEHLDDDKAVTEIVRVLKKGGTLLVTVPAFTSLWNENDDYSHHLRRYRKSELEALLTRHGLHISKLSYWNMLFFLPVWVVARFYTRGSGAERNNLSYIPKFLNLPLVWAMRAERAIGAIIPLPFGVSLYALAHK